MTSPLLDKNKNKCIKHCGVRKTMRGEFPSAGTIKTVYARMFCKRWSCPVCGPRKAWRMQQDIAEAAKEHNLDRLMTLTLDPKKVKGPPLKHLNDSWAKLRMAFKRKFKQSVSFIAVNEYHKSGMPHKHVLVDHYIHQAWLSNKWQKLGGGKIVDIRKITDIDNMAKYVGKYLGKDVLIEAPKGSRRVSTSQNIKLNDKVSEGNWSVDEAEVDQVFEAQKESVENEVRDKNNRLVSFERTRNVDFTHWGWPNDRPIYDLDKVPTPPGFDPEFFEIIAYRDLNAEALAKQEKESTDDQSFVVRPCFQQGTALGGFFNSVTDKALGGLCA
jgi:hypothetical protein